MLTATLETGLIRTLTQRADPPAFPMIVAAVAMAATLSTSVPYALPLALTPALIFAAIARLPMAEVLLALWLGKLVKYMVYGWLTATFPSWALRHGNFRVAALDAALSRSPITGISKSPARVPTP